MFPESSSFCRSVLSLTVILSLAFCSTARVLSTTPGVVAANVSSLYAPAVAGCPSTPLVRKAAGLSSQEASYIAQRKRLASQSLAQWLKKTNPGFEIVNLPTVALSSSGGGYRAMLVGAGVVQAFDERESTVATKGLYQAITYHSGLSGGSWLLSSIIGNDLDTITDLSKDLWQKALLKNSIWPLNTAEAPELPQVTKDIQARNAAGFAPTTAEVWGRLLSYQLLKGQDGGAGKSLSSIASNPAFRNFSRPYPIMTALGVSDINGKDCDAVDEAIQYEFHPYEFGSWDKGVEAFTPTQYLGSQLVDGKPVQPGKCVKNFDNLGYILGTSSGKFNEGCGTTTLAVIASGLDPVVQTVHNLTRRDLFSPYPNPFRKYAGSPMVEKADELYLVDGGQANQNNPIWPFLQPSRGVDVVIVNDNSADTDDNWANGTEILHTYNEAKRAGLTRMPSIPDVATFMSKGLYKQACFFGCNKMDQLTIVWLPNTNYTFESNVPSSQFDYPKESVTAMIANGVQVALQGGDKQWPTCLGCAIAHKTAKALPSECTSCMQKYCVS